MPLIVQLSLDTDLQSVLERDLRKFGSINHLLTDALLVAGKGQNDGVCARLKFLVKRGGSKLVIEDIGWRIAVRSGAAAAAADMYQVDLPPRFGPRVACIRKGSNIAEMLGQIQAQKVQNAERPKRLDLSILILPGPLPHCLVLTNQEDAGDRTIVPFSSLFPSLPVGLPKHHAEFEELVLNEIRSNFNREQPEKSQPGKRYQAEPFLTELRFSN